MNTGLIITVILIALTVIALIIAVWKGLTRGIVKSSVRLGSILLTAIAAVILTAIFVPKIGDLLLAQAENSASDFVEFISADTQNAAQLRSVIYAFVSPFVFFAAFIPSLIVFTVIYAIVSKIALKNLTIDNGAAQKAVGILLNIVAEFIIVSCMLFPTTYYTPIAHEAISYIVTENEKTDDALLPLPESAFEPILSATEEASKNPLSIAYSLPGKLVANFTTKISVSECGNITLKQLITSLLPVYGELNAANSDSLTPANCYNMATILDENDKTDKLVGDALTEIFGAWQKGEEIIGMPPPEFGDEHLTESVYGALANGKNASEKLRSAGHLISLTTILDSNSDKSDIKDALLLLIDHLTPESAQTLKNVLTKEVIASVGDMGIEHAEAYKTTVSSIVDELLKIKGDSEKTAEAIQAILEDEAEYISHLLDVINNPEDTNADTIIRSISESPVLQATLNDVTNNGSTRDPLGIADSISDDTAEEIYAALATYGIEENSDLYNQVMAFIGR